jgi:hypothetical protein
MSSTALTIVVAAAGASLAASSGGYPDSRVISPFFLWSGSVW